MGWRSCKGASGNTCKILIQTVMSIELILTHYEFFNYKKRRLLK